MPSNAQNFYLPNTKTGTLPAGVYDLSDATGTYLRTTTTTFTTTASAQRRLHPFTANNTNTAPPAVGAAAIGQGWRIPLTQVDSQVNALRIVPAGVWRYQMAYTTGTYALLAGSPAYVLTVVVYRIRANGTSEELWRQNSANQTTAQNTQNFISTGTTSRPEVVLEAGETIQVEWYFTGAATQNTLGQVTNNAVTFDTGGTGFVVELPTPGLRTRYGRATTDAAPASDGPVSRLAFFPRKPVDTLVTADAAGRVYAGKRTNIETVTGVDSLGRTYFAKRGLTEVNPTTIDLVARSLILRRLNEEATVVGETLALSLIGRRQISETTSVLDAAGRKFTGTRALTESTALADSLGRKVVFTRSLTENTSVADSVARQLVVNRGVADNAPASETIFRQLTYVRGMKEYPPGITPDFEVIFPTRAIAGFVYNHETGDPVPAAIVKMFRTSDDKLVQSTTSAGDGAYSFPRDTFDPNDYYILAYYTTQQGLQVHGVSDRNLVPS